MKYIQLCFLAIYILACKEKSEPEPIADLSGKIKQITIGSESKWLFNYDTKTGVLLSRTIQNLAKKTEITESYQRDSLNKIKQIKIIENGQIINWVCTYKNGLLDQIMPEGTPPNRTVFSYKYLNGQWSSIVKQVFVNNSQTFSGFITVAWTEANPTKLRNSLIAGSFEEEDWQYESRANSIASFFKKELGLLSGPDFGTINPLMVSSTLPRSQLYNFEYGRFRYSYSYNALERLSAISIEQQSLSGTWSKKEDWSILYYTE